MSVGIVYGDLLRRMGLRDSVPKLLGRAWTLYVLAVWLTLGLVMVAMTFGLSLATRFTADPARFIVEVITLRRIYYLLERVRKGGIL